MVTKKCYSNRQYINCNFSRLIYLLTCTKCGKQYIGQPARALKVCICEHICDIKWNRGTNVSENFDVLIGGYRVYIVHTYCVCPAYY